MSHTQPPSQQRHPLATDENGRLHCSPPPEGMGGVSPQLYMEVVAQSPTAITITDTSAHIIYANPAFERLTGYGLEELVGQRTSILSYKATPLRIYQALWSTILGGDSWQGVLVNRRKDGSRYLSELTISPVFEKGDRPAYFISMQRDVTDLHGLTTQLGNQQRLLESILDATPMLVVLVDPDGKVLLDNRAYQELSVAIGGDLLVKAFMQRLNTPLERGRLFECDPAPVLIDGEILLEFAGGLEPRWFACSGSWVREDRLGAEGYFELQGACALLITANEITQQKRQQEAVRLNALRALLTEQAMGQRLRETLAGALYQMQVPINMLDAAAALLQHQLGAEAPIHATLQQVLGAGREAINLLQKALPQESQGEAVAADLSQVIRDVLMVSTERLLAEGLIVDWKPSNTPVLVLDQKGALSTLIKHLLDNAIDAVNEPGAHLRELLISVTPQAGGYVELVVQDSGVGIERSLLRRVFEPFFSQWASGKYRSGMGLTIAQQIVLSLQGELEIDPDYHPGCRMRVTLPHLPTNTTTQEY